MNATTREDLQAEFTELRNAKMKRPASSNTRLRNIYFDHLNQTEALANSYSDEELAKSIQLYKNNNLRAP